MLFGGIGGIGLGNYDVDGGAGFDGVQLDLLDVLFGGFGVGGALFGEFGGARADAGVGAVDVVVEDFLGVVVGGCYAKSNH